MFKVQEHYKLKLAIICVRENLTTGEMEGKEFIERFAVVCKNNLHRMHTLNCLIMIQLICILCSSFDVI